MPKRTQAERIADRAAAREKSGQTLTKRQQNTPTPTPTPSPTKVQGSSGPSISDVRPSAPSQLAPRPSPSPRPGSVADNRAAAAAANQSMKDYKAANNITPKHTSKERQSTATQTNGNISTYDPNSVGAQNEKYSHNDIKALKSQGYSVNEIGARINELGDGANLGAAAQRLRDKYVLSLTDPNPTPTPTPTPTTTPTPTPTPTPTSDPYPTPNPGGGGGGNTDVDITNTQTLDVQQDNDQTSTIIGDNNTVTQDQDNSIDQLGGNNSTTVNGGTAGSAEQADSLKNDYVNSIVNPFNSGGGNLDADIKNDQQLTVTQDNDQTSTITGNNNTVWQQQDNSIRQYGGDNRSFIYNGSGGYMDTPVSAATMGGFYDVDDSPAAQAKFNDLHTTLNQDNQKRFAGMGMKTAGMFSGFNAASFDPAALQTRIDQSTQRSFDQATVKDNDVFGDRDLYRGLLSGYNFGKPPKKVEYGDD